MYQSLTSEYTRRDGDEAIYAIALKMVDESGLSGLTAREISKRAGLSPSGFLYRYGSREAFLAEFASWLIKEDQKRWKAYASELSDAPTPDSLKSLAHAVVTDRIDAHREMLLSMWEFQLLASRSADFSPFLAAWRKHDVDFWSDMLPRFGLPSSLAAGWAGSLLGCMRIGLMSDKPLSGRIWMDDILTRLTERLFNTTPSRPGDSLARQDAETNLATPNAVQEKDGTTRSRIISAASNIIMEDGCAALSHRAIAKKTGISLSSTTHHFQTLNDILSAAFETIYAAAREQAQQLPRQNRTYTRTEFSRDILPNLAGPQQIGRTGAMAMDDIMLRAARDSANKSLAAGLIALSGSTTLGLLAGISDSEKTYDRLDSHIVRLCLNGVMCGADVSEGGNFTPQVAEFLSAYL